MSEAALENCIIIMCWGTQAVPLCEHPEVSMSSLLVGAGKEIPVAVVIAAKPQKKSGCAENET
eukprot:scaffold3953_cov146-Skeletonema_menzelii.AAC.4